MLDSWSFRAPLASHRVLPSRFPKRPHDSEAFPRLCPSSRQVLQLMDIIGESLLESTLIPVACVADEWAWAAPWSGLGRTPCTANLVRPDSLRETSAVPRAAERPAPRGISAPRRPATSILRATTRYRLRTPSMTTASRGPRGRAPPRGRKRRPPHRGQGVARQTGESRVSLRLRRLPSRTLGWDRRRCVV